MKIEDLPLEQIGGGLIIIASAYALPKGDDGGDSGGDGTREVPAPIRPGTLIAGGDGYGDTFTASDADEVVSTRSELDYALQNASSGDVVFIEESARIETSYNNEIIVPKGVTLASNRGVNGSQGATIFRDDAFQTSRDPMIQVRDNGRVTGLTARGSNPTYDGSNEGHVIRADSGVEVDNCDLSAAGYAGVGFHSGGNNKVHHCRITETQGHGLGYGVKVSGSTEVYANYFNKTRHSLSGGGGSNYHVHDNHFGPDMAGTVVDVHGTGQIDGRAGNRIVVEYNHAEAEIVYTGRFAGEYNKFFALRGVPSDEAIVRHNFHANGSVPPMAKRSGWERAVVLQIHVSSAPEFDKLTLENNQWGN